MVAYAGSVLVNLSSSMFCMFCKHVFNVLCTDRETENLY